MSVRDLRTHLTHPVSAVDAAVGQAVDAAMIAKHRLRLARRGWRWVYDLAADAPLPADAPERPGDTWWVPGVAVREGNSVEVLVDGATIAPRIRDLIAQAQHHVHLTAWHASPDFPMDADGTTLHDVLRDAAERVPTRLLMWAGAPVPVFPPSRHHVDADRVAFERDSRLQVVLDRRERPMHCHHEKIVVIDDEVAVVGGLDLTTLQGNRYDAPGHPSPERMGWHDAAMVVRGPIVADIANHVVHRWNEVSGDDLPEATPQQPVGSVVLQMLRTIPNDVYDFAPRGEYTGLAGYLSALRAAQHLVYLENQFLWSPEVVDVLLDKLQNPPAPDFRVLLVLPRKPSSGADTTNGQLARLIAADDGRGHLLAVTLLGPVADGDGVYVHAKVGIIDDRWLTIGSTNLNEHSLYNDTEMNLLTLDEQLARQVRIQLWSEHLQVPASELQGPPTELIDGIWTTQCNEQDAAASRGDDESHHEQGRREHLHRVQRLSGLSSRVDRVRGPLMGLVVDG